jgi:threonine dehydrogenase-like Zn-dependent dehydrogenase
VFLPLREPQTDELLIRIEGCGVCGSNLPAWEGRPWFTYPLAPGTPGHEAWGIVEGTGPGVSTIRRGERVAVLIENGFAEYALAQDRKAVVLPKELDGHAFPGEPLACAINAARRSAMKPGETVAIVGIGFLGALLTTLAKRAGARVAAITRRQFGLGIAEQFGADATFSWDDRAATRMVSYTGGKGFDCVIEAAGVQASLDLAAQLTKERGRLVIAGYHQDGLRQVDLQLWNWRGIDVINAHERDPQVYVDGMREALRLVVTGELDPAPLYTHMFPLSQLGRALDALRTRPEGFMKALVIP